MMSQPDQVSRPLPAIGIFALLAAGHDPALIAKAFDVPTTTIKQYGESAVQSLVDHHDIEIGVVKRRLFTLAPFVRVAIEQATKVNWQQSLNALNQLEVIETMAYFRSFLNCPVIKES